MTLFRVESSSYAHFEHFRNSLKVLESQLFDAIQSDAGFKRVKI